MRANSQSPGTRLNRRDRFLHEPRFRDWNWVETNWFCFFVPDEAMVGHLRSLWRPTLGIVGANVFVYSNRGLDATGALANDMHEDRFAMPMPPHNLDDYRLDNGIAVRQTEAFHRWEVRYDGNDGTVFDLEYTALMPPVEVGEIKVVGAGEGFGSIQRSDAALSHGHIDQTLHVSGEVVVNGIRFGVDCAVNRDHSWGPRRESVARLGCGNFDDGHWGDDFHFLVQTRNDTPDSCVVTHGYLLDDGDIVRIAEGTGRFELDGYRTTGLVYEIVDERGRHHRIEGRVARTIEKVSTNAFSCNGFVDWSYEGEPGIGEYRWHWGVRELRDWLAKKEAEA